jgi:hypothetical protein
MRHRACGRLITLAVGVAALAVAAAPAAAQTPGLPVLPILGDPQGGSVTPFEGSAATPAPVGGMSDPPRNPFLAPNGRSNIHDDAYMSDTYAVSGPLADGPERSSLFARECASITFDSQGRLVTICVGLERPVLTLLDPHTLRTLAAMPLPFRNLQSGANPFTDFTGGGYFYLDDQDRAVLTTNDHHLLVVAIRPGPSFAVVGDYDLSGDLAASDGIVSALPDYGGRLWFVTRQGVVGTVERQSGAVRTLQLAGEGISNSFAVDETGGVFIVSDEALYRFDADANGAPRVSWREAYPNSGVHKPGQSDAGSGTTPTVMGKRWVAITDNADPMDVLVYERARRLSSPKAKRKRKHKRHTRRRLVCSEPVFEKGASATDQSLIATDRSIVTENNYGYSVTATMNGGVTAPGLTRVDVVKVKPKKRKARHGGRRGKRKRRKGKASFRCRTVWTSDEIAPSVVPKLSLGDGLVYTYTKPPRQDRIDAWYLTALDFRSGRTVYRRLAGTGFGFNNNYAPVTLAPDGWAYVGVLGGVVAFSP